MEGIRLTTPANDTPPQHFEHDGHSSNSRPATSGKQKSIPFPSPS